MRHTYFGGFIDDPDSRFQLCKEYLDRLIDIATEADDDSYCKFRKDDLEGYFYSDLSNRLDGIIEHVRNHSIVLYNQWNEFLDSEILAQKSIEEVMAHAQY